MFLKSVIDECDAVISAIPPGFRPDHFVYAKATGIQVFMKKPLAVDGLGYRKIIEVGKIAAEKKLNVAVGLQFRCDITLNKIASKIHAGDIISMDVQSECLQLFRLLDTYLKQRTATKNKIHGEVVLGVPSKFFSFFST